jgi:hypothetical protein
MKHALFSASGAERWVNCSGSLALSAIAPVRPSGAAAREGTAGHTLADECLTKNLEPVDFEGVVFNVEGHDIEITDELALAVQAYVDYVRGISGLRWTETRTYYSQLLGVDTEEAFGTTDCSILNGTVLHIVDAKFGRKFVDAKKNKQTILYAAGVVDTIEAIGEEVTEIHLHIVQPRVSEKPIPYVMTREELRAEVAVMREAAQKAQEANIAFVDVKDKAWAKRYLSPGETQCMWCPAASFCPALRAEADDLTGEDTEHLNGLSSEYIAEALGRVPLLERWIEAVQHEALSRLSNGKPVQGFKLVLGREGNRRWNDVDKAAEAFGDLPVDVTHKPAALLPPAQMEKALKKLKLARSLGDLVVRNPAKPTMTTADDPRAEWSPANAIAEEFGVVA